MTDDEASLAAGGARLSVAGRRAGPRPWKRAAGLDQLQHQRRHLADDRGRRHLLLLVALVFPSLAGAQVLGLGSGQQGSISYNISAAISRTIEGAGIHSRVQPYSGSSAVLPLVNSGELDLAICNVLEIQEAAAGEGPYKGRKQTNLRVLAVIFPLYAGIFVRKDSPIKTLAELKGKRLPYGFAAQNTVERIIDGVLANDGLERKDIVQVLVPNVVRGADDFMEGKLDGGFFAVGAAKVLEVDKS